MQATEKHFHGWILTIDGTHVSFEPIQGAYAGDMKCRRQATREAGGDGSKVIVLLCRGDDHCPSKYEVATVGT